MFLVFTEIKHKFDLDGSHIFQASFNAQPELNFLVPVPQKFQLNRVGGGFAYVSYDILKGIYLCCKVYLAALLKLKAFTFWGFSCGGGYGLMH